LESALSRKENGKSSWQNAVSEGLHAESFSRTAFSWQLLAKRFSLVFSSSFALCSLFF
jgi:hypothetical protein